MWIIFLLINFVFCLAGPATDSSVVHFPDGAEKMLDEKSANKKKIVLDDISAGLRLRNNFGPDFSNNSNNNFSVSNNSTKINDSTVLKEIATDDFSNINDTTVLREIATHDFSNINNTTVLREIATHEFSNINDTAVVRTNDSTNINDLSLVRAVTERNNFSKLNEPATVLAVAQGNQDFGLRLYDTAKKEERNNLLISPFSVSSVMAMVSLGAMGKTLEEVRKGMNFPVKNDLVAGYRHALSVLKGNDNFTLETANNLFVQDGFTLLEDFVKIMKEGFLAEVEQTDFVEKKGEVARKLINDWVEEKTREKIRDLISKNTLSRATKVVLVNAIYFKGDWASKFDTEATLNQNFYIVEGKAVQVAMMNKMENFKMAYVDDLNSEVLELPYKGDRMSMYIILPRVKFGLNDVEKELSKANLLDIFSTIDTHHKRRVHLALPKFKLEKKLELKELLQQLGIVDLFEEGRADLSGIAEHNDLFVSKVVQKAFIEVNEEGSEAAAATAVISLGRSLPPPPHQFVCDHPFIFFILDKLTDMVLFSGRITNPKLN